MLGVGVLAGLACIGLGVTGVLRRDHLTIERIDQTLLLPGSPSKREVRLEEVESIEVVVGVSRTVQIQLQSGELIVLQPNLYGGAARLAARLEELRAGA